MTNCSPIIAGTATLVFIAIILFSRFRKHIQDIPNERSLHTRPVPRTGGIGILVGILAGWAVMAESVAWWLTFPLLVLFLVSLLDDMRSLPVRQRLLSQLFAALVLVFGAGVFSHHGVITALAVVICTVWMTNLYNFMDGSDGLAGGMALLGFATYGLAAGIAHADTFALMNFCISASALAFLCFNFHPARIFMGDAGSIPLGFLVAAMGLHGWQQGYWSAWFPPLVFSPFVVDASATLLKRTLRKAKITEAHREHYYQRAIHLGWTHHRLALVEYLLMLASSAIALLIMAGCLPWQSVFGLLGIYGALMLVLDLKWKRSELERHHA